MQTKMSLIALLLAALTPHAGAQESSPANLPFVSPMFSSHMVLQRDMKVPVWGWTTPGARVNVIMNGSVSQAKAGADGKWEARIGPLKAGGPYSLFVTGPRSVSFEDVLVGDVWLCSGQSNMEMGIGLVNDAQKEIAAANYPKIRLFNVAKTFNTVPQSTLKGEWLLCTPDNIKRGPWEGFSAAAYFFGRELNKQLNVPIGLIQSAWGGTNAESWTGAEGLAAMPDFAADLKLRADYNAAPAGATPPGPIKDNVNFPTVLYNGMISPVIPFAIKGAIWYQGEGNAGRAYQYRTLLPTMIGDWRHRWNEGRFPFLIVQLAGFMQRKAEPADDAWAELREAQYLTAATGKNIGIATAVDIGDAGDIHPKNKQEVGRRLALVALARFCGKKVAYSGPEYRSMKIEKGAIRLTFDHVGGGLVARDGKTGGFAVAGEDRKFVWADVKVEGDTLVVSAAGVPNPVAVRYAWDANPETSIFNGDGLPLFPFRTDNWPLSTQPK
ncbi:MAG TPA: sialate O-acetylesterase [Armatimonadota bacterium]|jgi:sialate O-acetylesterase